MTIHRGNRSDSRLKVGETFDSFLELKHCIVEHGVKTERIIVSYKKDKKRYLAHCKMNCTSEPVGSRCSWRIRAWLKKKTNSVTITQAHTVHSCEAAGHWKRRMHSNSDYVAQTIFDIVMRNRQTRACSLRDTAQALIHPDIQYHTAYAAKKRALEKLDGREKDSFFLIPTHCQHILERDSNATAKWSAPDGHFESLFVMPSAAREAYKHCRPLVAFDGTFTRCKYPQILLIATALDANNTVLMLAYCMVPTENPAEWRRFLRLIQEAIPELDRPGTVFIFDREKGLLDGVEEYFPRGFHAYCSWHLGDNCRTHFNKKAEKDFEPLVYATTVEQYKRRFDRIKQKNQKLADYIQKIADPKHYSRAYCPVRRWGHETSQQAESLNRALKPQRQEVVFKQSNLLWDYIMDKFFEKRQLSLRVSTPFPPNIMTILRNTEEKASLLIADASSDSECRVTDHLGRQFLVQFQPEWKCSCGDWQDTLLPCTHAWRACTKLKKRQFDYVSDYYKTSAFQSTYAQSVPAILFQDLVPDSNCGEPLIKRKRGRPSEKARMRFEEEDPVRRLRHYSHCKEVGHDKRKCPTRAAVLAQAKGRGPTMESDDESLEAYHEFIAAPDIGDTCNQFIADDDIVDTCNEFIADDDSVDTCDQFIANDETEMSDMEGKDLGTTSEILAVAHRRDEYISDEDDIGTGLQESQQISFSQTNDMSSDSAPV